MDIQVSFNCKRNSSVLKPVSDGLERFAAAFDKEIKVYVAFVDDSIIRALNMRFKKRDKPTNVLSFEINQKDPEDDKVIIGEIIISVDTAKREADNADMPVCRRLEELFVHGFVHLLGYNHTGNKAEAGRMKKKETALMKKFDERKSAGRG